MHVTIMGCLYKFTKSGRRKYLERWLETGTQPNINNFAACLATSMPNITDWEESDVENALIS